MLIDILPTDAYNDSQELADNTNWSTNTVVPMVPLSVIGNLVTEKWMRLGGSFLSRLANFGFESGGQNEFEYHFLLNFQTTINGGSGEIAVITNTNTQTGRGILLQYQPSSSGTGSPSVLQVSSIAGSSPLLEDYPVIAGTTYHVVMRLRGETMSGGGVNDGAYEVWINGNKVAGFENINWDTNNADAGFTLSRFGFGNPSTANDIYVRDGFVYDQWTSAFGTMTPEVGILTVNTATSVAGPFTNEGGAVDEVTALSDGDDTTFLQATSAGDALNLGFTVDPSIASLPLKSVVVQSRISRDSAAFNNIDIELQNAAGDTVLGTEVVPVSAIEPARQPSLRQIVPSSSVDANDFSIEIRNGS